MKLAALLSFVLSGCAAAPAPAVVESPTAGAPTIVSPMTAAHSSGAATSGAPTTAAPTSGAPATPAYEGLHLRARDPVETRALEPHAPALHRTLLACAAARGGWHEELVVHVGVVVEIHDADVDEPLARCISRALLEFAERHGATDLSLRFALGVHPPKLGWYDGRVRSGEVDIDAVAEALDRRTDDVERCLRAEHLRSDTRPSLARARLRVAVDRDGRVAVSSAASAGSGGWADSSSAAADPEATTRRCIARAIGPVFRGALPSTAFRSPEREAVEVRGDLPPPPVEDGIATWLAESTRRTMPPFEVELTLKWSSTPGAAAVDSLR